MPAPSFPTLLSACAVGGTLGSLGRWAVDEAAAGGAGGSLASTTAVNVVGCLILGLLLGSPMGQDPMRRAFLGAGVLGGFTTFSTYAVQVRATAAGGQDAKALGYAAVTVVGCLLAAHVGRRFAEHRDTLTPADEQGDA